MAQTNNQIVEIVQFTDPVCTWCWGSEPILRKLEESYGDKLKFSYVMGGLVKNVFEFYDSHNDIGGDPESSNKQVAKHWLDASARHGMPVKTDGFNLLSKEYPSTYPQNIAYKAAQMQGEEIASKFLRRIREASAAEAKLTSRTEVLIELASETGLDISQFLDDFTNGKAQKAFEEDLYTTKQFGVNGFPTFLLKSGEKSILLRGYQQYNTFKAVINQLTSGKIQEIEVLANENIIFEFILKHNAVAPAEIKTAFSLSDEQMNGFLDSLFQKQRIKKREAGNGYFVLPQENTLMCNAETAVCEG